MTESALVTASMHVASLSLLGRMPPLHLLLAAAIFLPGQVVAVAVVVVVFSHNVVKYERNHLQTVSRRLQVDWLLTLDPGACASTHL